MTMLILIQLRHVAYCTMCRQHAHAVAHELYGLVLRELTQHLVNDACTIIAHSGSSDQRQTFVFNIGGRGGGEINLTQRIAERGRNDTNVPPTNLLGRGGAI